MTITNEQFYEVVKEIIHTELNNLGILKGQWHFGVVDTITSSKKIKVFIDNSITSQEIGCNPDVAFATGDHVLIIYLNGNNLDKFAISKRAV